MRVALAMMVVASAGCERLLDLPAVPDAPNAAPAFVLSTYAHDGAVTSISVPLTMPDVPRGFLVVSIGLAGNDTTTPSVASITYAGHALAPLEIISGVPTHAQTRTEQWQLVAPPAGADTIVVNLNAPGLTVHAAALVFQNVNQTTPVRAHGSASGVGSTSAVSVASAPGDLVESTVGHGGGVMAPDASQMTAFIDNVSGNNSLDNAAGSTAPGASPSVTMRWTMSSSDSWQQIAASLRP